MNNSSVFAIFAIDHLMKCSGKKGNLLTAKMNIPVYIILYYESSVPWLFDEPVPQVSVDSTNEAQGRCYTT